MTPLVPRRYQTVPGRSYGTPKELWGFRTAAVRGAPRAIARRFLRDRAELLGIHSVRSRLRLARVIGRDVADRIVVESHFQLDGFTSFVKGARAILDADRHLFRGRHVAAMRRIFREQGIGPVE
jgi:hypothetical protein